MGPGSHGARLARHEVDGRQLGVELGRDSRSAGSGRAASTEHRHRLDGAGGAEECPVTPLIEVTGGPGSAEHLRDGLGLGGVVERGGGAVGVDLARCRSASRPASARASSMHDTAPAPAGRRAR